MAKLYETLNEMVDDDITQKFNPKEIQDISDKIEYRAKKKIGDTNYQKLEQYIIKNKDDEDLKEFTEEALELVMFSSIALLMGNGTAKEEIKIGYKLINELYTRLEAACYDAEQALLDL